jgi:hypothetical protein
VAYDTVSNYLADVRVLLQDLVLPYRYDDPSLLTALNATLLETRRIRPDLLLPFLNDVPEFDTNDDTIVPIEQPFRLAIVHGIVGHALARDQEDIQDQRATVFMGTFNTMLVGPASAMSRPPAGGRNG